MGMFRSSWFKELFAVSPHAARGGGDLQLPAGILAPQPVLVAFASQTGLAEELARATCEALSAGVRKVRLRAFHDVDIALLEATPQAIFIISTTCDGDPPDM